MSSELSSCSKGALCKQRQIRFDLRDPRRSTDTSQTNQTPPRTKPPSAKQESSSAVRENFMSGDLAKLGLAVSVLLLHFLGEAQDDRSPRPWPEAGPRSAWAPRHTPICSGRTERPQLFGPASCWFLSLATYSVSLGMVVQVPCSTCLVPRPHLHCFLRSPKTASEHQHRAPDATSKLTNGLSSDTR